jgi:uncharacterized protein YjbI with pentapeptide repeats
MWLVVGVVVGTVFVALVVAGYSNDWRWTGFRASGEDAKQQTKTLWDWLGLLIVPLVVALAIFALNDAQTRRQAKTETARALRQDHIAADQRHEQALRDYLQRMSDLILDRHLGSKQAGLRVEALAQTLTLTVLRQLDGRRKGIVLAFLANSDLIRNDVGPNRNRESGPLNLDHADLNDAALPHVQLGAVAIEGAYLENADFSDVIADEASFFDSDLKNANFRGASLDNVTFEGADLRGADLSDVITVDDDLGGPLFGDSCLTGATFRGDQFFKGTFRQAEGRNVDFSDASFEGTSFERARLSLVYDRRPEFDDQTRQTMPRGWGDHGASFTAGELKRLCQTVGPDS